MRQVRKKFADDYFAVLPGEKELPALKKAVGKLKGELNRIKNLKKGRLNFEGRTSSTARLVMILQAFNKAGKSTDLKVDSISISPRSISISGDTRNTRATLELRKKLEAEGLEIVNESIEEKAGRGVFNLTVTPKSDTG